MKNASPIGIWKLAQRSSGMSRSGSHSVRLPAGRYSGSPERTFQQLSHAQSIRRSTRCSRWRWRSGIVIAHRSHTSPASSGLRAGGRRRPPGPDGTPRPLAAGARARPDHSTQPASPAGRGGEPRPHRRAANAADRDGCRWRSRRERHLDASELAQQRHRVQLDALLVHRAPRARQEERACTVRARERPAGERAVVERAAAGRAERRGRRAACPRRSRSEDRCRRRSPRPSRRRAAPSLRAPRTTTAAPAAARPP